jgi:hypothetical protein
LPRETLIRLIWRFAMNKKDSETGQGDSQPTAPSVEELKEKLCAELREYDKAELESLRLEKYKTGKLWDIGNVAVPLKEAMEHGEWEPFVKQCVQEKGISSDRTLQRAMKIRKNFERREDCVGLTVTEADDVARRAENIAVNGETACKRVTNKSNRELADEIRKLRQTNERWEADLLRHAEGQGVQVQPQIEVVPAPAEVEADAEPAKEDVDSEAAVVELTEAVSDIAREENDLTPEEEQAFAAFVHALGDSTDRALVVVVTQKKAELRKSYL